MQGLEAGKEGSRKGREQERKGSFFKGENERGPEIKKE